MDIREAIRVLAQTRGEMYCKICLVDAVDEGARTVDVSPIDDGAPILGVNLQADQNAKVGVVAFPKKGSHVAVSFLNPEAAVVVLCSEIERIEVKANTDVTVTAGGNVSVTNDGDITVESAGKVSIKSDADITVASGGKVSVKNGSYSLATAFADLIAAIGKLTVTTGVGPSGPPINIAEFQKIEANIKQLLQ